MGVFPKNVSYRDRQLVYTAFLKENNIEELNTAKMRRFADDKETKQIFKHGRGWCGQLMISNRSTGWTIGNEFVDPMHNLLELLDPKYKKS